jgi:hypothetical protein
MSSIYLIVQTLTLPAVVQLAEYSQAPFSSPISYPVKGTQPLLLQHAVLQKKAHLFYDDTFPTFAVSTIAPCIRTYLSRGALMANIFLGCLIELSSHCSILA